MRRFILLSNTVDTSKPLSLSSLTSYGRLDVLCRCINSAFFLSNHFRKDVILEIFFLKNNKILKIQGEKVKGINPDERAIAGILKKVFQGRHYIGVKFYSESLENLINNENPIIMESGGVCLTNQVPIRKTFLIGDQLGFPAEKSHLFVNLDKISLGPYAYLSSQTITIINYLLDTQYEITD